MDREKERGWDTKKEKEKKMKEEEEEKEDRRKNSPSNSFEPPTLSGDFLLFYLLLLFLLLFLIVQVHLFRSSVVVALSQVVVRRSALVSSHLPSCHHEAAAEILKGSLRMTRRWLMTLLPLEGRLHLSSSLFLSFSTRWHRDLPVTLRPRRPDLDDDAAITIRTDKFLRRGREIFTDLHTEANGMHLR